MGKVKEIILKENKGRKKMFINIVLICLYLILTVSGLVLFKLGTTENFSVSYASGKLSILLNLKVILGLLCYICSFLLYMFLVSKFDLSYIVPVTQGIIYILIFASSVAIFKEKITIPSIIGTIMVIVGIVLLNIKIGD